ncbi:BglII/BstYI family type II restriction endonuclease [Bacillus cereus]|uniref:BglII/BstYI family type II restriction endonuclease n=1 Tax=Bacillus TaxID=1386 RepID=UPI0020CCE073|nr:MULTISPECIES: BglII/BstYI family type II restriction endonuclease [Bacillus]MEB8905358.1 BglII/BstYI family type II restriction endonuclease [Bacillus cereus]MDM5036141.1 BglII/BstYI family type II restriction endonuclease [Bacillus sp. OR-18]MEB9922967.1 BglII/BstYI family type II restriction endonuclease [Bacillus cereus]MEB9986139.1 BglII/BstYI family type II restriction endonuclease [Bacillus cereus]MEB9992249.1 BglII/BstYI family type II restriction endonuclease [Bacillus cereus]
MSKVVHLEESLEVDLLIYITATDNLEKYLSEGIVTFNKMKKTLEQYGSIVKIPVWLIGIDFRD